jgi:hypothetical protein
MPRTGLMPLGTLGVVGSRFVLPGGHMHRRLLMMRCGRFARICCLCVLFLDLLCHCTFCVLLLTDGGF